MPGLEAECVRRCIKGIPSLMSKRVLKILEDLEADPRHIKYIYTIYHIVHYVNIFIYIYYKLNIYCTYIQNSEVPPAVRAGCHGRMMEENLM